MPDCFSLKERSILSSISGEGLDGSSPRVRVLTYLFLVFSLSSVFYVLCIRHGMKTSYVFGLMWCPAAAGILTGFLTKRPWREFGWGLGKARYLLAGRAIPMIYIWPAYLLVWVTGQLSVRLDKVTLRERVAGGAAACLAQRNHPGIS